MLPVVVVTGKVPALLRVNGRTAGELGPDAPLSFPAAPGERLYLEALPLAGRLLPVLRRLDVPETGRQAGQSAPDVETAFWPDCVEAALPALALPEEEEPAALLDEIREEGFCASLFRQMGVHFCLEKGNAVLVSKTIARHGGGSLRLLPGHVLVFGENRCLCVRTEDGAATLDLSGGEFSVWEGEVLQKTTLPTCRAHQREARFDPFTGALRSEALSPTRQPQTLSEAGRSLCEAVGLGRFDEAGTLLSGGLSALSGEELTAFFGKFDRVRVHPFRRGTIGLFSAGEPWPRVFCFEGKRSETGWQIENAWEEEEEPE